MSSGGTNLAMRELVYGESVGGFLLIVEPIGKDIGKGERNEEYQK
jgi:hypothetical protein